MEEIIRELTAHTPSGGTCRFGDGSFRVWYCSDIWEWEYQGETYWDPLDLARALVRDCTLARWHDASTSTKVKGKKVLARTKRPATKVRRIAGSWHPRKDRL